MDLKQDAQPTNDELDYEDVVIEFEGNFDFNSVRGKELKVIGIDTEEPIILIDQKYYKLDIKNSIGTRLLLEKDSDKKLKYYGKTDKVAKARRVIVKQKLDTQAKAETNATETDL